MTSPARYFRLLGTYNPPSVRIGRRLFWRFHAWSLNGMHEGASGDVVSSDVRPHSLCGSGRRRRAAGSEVPGGVFVFTSRL